MTLQEQKRLYTKARDAYYNTKGKAPIMSDAEFDKLEKQIAKQDPDFVKSTGILGKKSDFALHYPMPSLNKVHYGDDSRLTRMVSTVAKHTQGLDSSNYVVVSEKLDGSSVQATYNKGTLESLVTRGNGIVGQDITFLAPHTKLPKSIRTTRRLVVRMEAILAKTVASKLKMSPALARAASAGALNRMSKSDILSKLDFVVLRTLGFADETPQYLKGLTMAACLGFETVQHRKLYKHEASDDQYLKGLLEMWKRPTNMFELDGLVLHADTNEISIDNPKFAFSFKLNEEAETAPLTTIEEVIWQVSSFNVAVPKARVTPVDFDGVTVQYVSMSNWKLASENGWGVGAKVRIVRSGEIIPKIVKTEKEAKLAKPKHLGELSLDATGTNLIVAGGSVESEVRKLSRFFSAVELDGFGPALAEKMVALGIDTARVCTMLHMKDWKVLGIDNEKTRSKLASEVYKLTETADLATIMAYCGVFGKGVGSTRIQSLLTSNPTVFETLAYGETLKEGVGEKIYSLCASTPGCGEVFAMALTSKLKSWFKWRIISGLEFKKPNPLALAKPKSKLSNSLENECVSFTGYRDKAQEASVEENGGSVVPFGAKTTIIMYDAEGKKSTKVSKAAEKGLKVVERKAFRTLFRK